MLFFFKQKTAYEMRISDWSSDVCASYLVEFRQERHDPSIRLQELVVGSGNQCGVERDACIRIVECDHAFDPGFIVAGSVDGMCERPWHRPVIVEFTASHASANHADATDRSEEDTYELKSLMRNS